MYKLLSKAVHIFELDIFAEEKIRWYDFAHKCEKAWHSGALNHIEVDIVTFMLTKANNRYIDDGGRISFFWRAVAKGKKSRDGKARRGQ